MAGRPTFRHDQSQALPQEVERVVVDEQAPTSASLEQSAAPAASAAPQATPEQQAPDIATLVQQAVDKAIPALRQSLGFDVPAPTNITTGRTDGDKRRAMWSHWLQHASGGERSLGLSGGALDIDMAAVQQANDEETSLMSIARAFARDRLGREPSGRSEIFRHSFVSTGDFPLILEDAMNKRLAAMYQQATPTWTAVARSVSNNDFRERDVNFADATPELEEVIEGGEVRYQGGTEAQESYRIRTYAKGFRVTRQMVINDDLSFLSRKPNEYARAGISLENSLVWGEITSNATVQGSALFSASRGNRGSATSFALTAANLASAMASLKGQRDRNGNTILMLDFATLVVPPELEYEASQLLEAGGYAPNQVTNVIPGYVRRLNLVVEPLLSDNSTSVWYLFANPGSVDIGELAYLRGSSSPQIVTETTHSVMGVDYKGMHDVGAKIVDYLGTFKSVQANA